MTLLNFSDDRVIALLKDFHGIPFKRYKTERTGLYGSCVPMQLHGLFVFNVRSLNERIVKLI